MKSRSGLGWGGLHGGAEGLGGGSDLGRGRRGVSGADGGVGEAVVTVAVMADSR